MRVLTWMRSPLKRDYGRGDLPFGARDLLFLLSSSTDYPKEPSIGRGNPALLATAAFHRSLTRTVSNGPALAYAVQVMRRTAVINQIRSLLLERGITLRKGRC